MEYTVPQLREKGTEAAAQERIAVEGQLASSITNTIIPKKSTQFGLSTERTGTEKIRIVWPGDHDDSEIQTLLLQGRKIRAEGKYVHYKEDKEGYIGELQATTIKFL